MQQLDTTYLKLVMMDKNAWIIIIIPLISSNNHVENFNYKVK